MQNFATPRALPPVAIHHRFNDGLGNGLPKGRPSWAAVSPAMSGDEHVMGLPSAWIASARGPCWHSVVARGYCVVSRFTYPRMA